jgi:IS5 family transposase
VHDSQVLPELLHGDETRVWGDSAYSGQGEAIQACAPQAQDFTNKKGRRNRPLTDVDKATNRTKSQVRAKVEHPFHVLKRVFGLVQCRNPRP